MNPDEKQQQLVRLNELVTSPLTVGGAESGLNLADMYTHYENRDEVLSILQQRYPDQLGSMERLDPQSWFEKITSLQRPSSYVSGYAGEVGERQAIVELKRLGIDAHQFASRVHPANDLISDHGVAYSVKSYDPDSHSHFVSLVHHTPASTNYVVNEELYDRLKESGALASLHEDGIQILDGHFSHTESVARAHDVLERVGTHQDVSDSVFNDVPIVACIVGLASLGINGYRYSKGFASKNEFAVDMVGAVSRVAAGSGGAAAGSVAGAAIGTAVLPILGTLIGGTIGGILGSMGAKEIVRDTVAWTKWGCSLETFERLAKTYANGLPSGCVDAVASDILHKPQIAHFVESERQRGPHFSRELEPHDPTPPTVAAVLWRTAVDRAEASLPKITEASERVSDSLLRLCVNAAVARYPRQRVSARRAIDRMFGSFLVEVPLLRDALPAHDRASLSEARNELKANPNHPFKTDTDKRDILTAIAMKELADGEQGS